MGNYVDWGSEGIISFLPSNGILLQTIRVDAIKEGKSLGHILLIPHSHEMYEVHTSNVDISIKGSTHLVGKEMLLFVFKNISKIQKLITKVPVNNRLAARLTKRCGFKLEGNITSSFLVDGIMIDQEIYGITRGELECL